MIKMSSEKMGDRRSTIEGESFFMETARELLRDKYILIIGDSVQVRNLK